ncbi:ABC transporter permease [Alloacidobacterium dinghuense]|uniref:ABC transporter permease n=1 Tax=Alloacidobacterium dinghuense TaxID=2763107 RepID=A0A7G8BMH3_9BACT|nr:ABC transporter permease [Alloacidobacterium dinghuense]QNI33743.1 ABC transporter permease [Alloacidobacterium dinghuense]
MSLASRIATWWKAVTRPEQLNSEIEDELAFHIEAYANDLMRSGLPREEAFRRARAELGGLAAQKENCRAAWGTRAWDELRADLRYAIRMLAKSPSFTVIAICSLGLGIGANTTIFTLARQVLLDKLAVPKPEDLRLFSWTSPEKHRAIHRLWGHWERTPDGKYSCTSFSYPVYQQLRQQNRVFEDVFAFKIFSRLSATIDNKANAVTAELVSGNYYSSLGVRTVLGRGIQNSDDAGPLSGPVAVISDGFWSRRFGRSPDVVGKKIEVNLTPITIIGVNPPGFTGTANVQISPDIFLPFSMEPIAAPSWASSLLTNPDEWWVLVMGRAKPGISDVSAQAALDVVLRDAVRSTMTIKKDEEVPHFALRDGSRGDDPAGRNFAKPVYVLMALAGFVLLLACANLANLLLARASSRQREMSVRLALGAGRGRILRQMFTESLLLSMAGGIAGLILGYFGRNLVPHLMSSSWETAVATVHFDWKVFGFTAAVSIFTGLLFGLAPAWQATRTQVSSGLKDNTQSATQRSRNLAGKTLVVVQVALSMLLLVGAGLFVRTLVNLDKSHLGFRPDHLTLFEIQPPRTRYAAPKDIALYRRIEEQLSTIPGVDSVTLSKVPLITGGTSNNDFFPDGMPQKSNDDAYADDNAVGQNYFETMGIPIKAGRGFNQTDTETSRLVAVVDEQLVKKFFPNTNPLGRTFLSKKKHIEIIGVSGDARYPSLRDDPPATFYMPYRQQLDGEQSMTYEIHSRTAQAVLVQALRDAVASVDKDLPLLDIRTQNEQIEDSTKEERIFASLTSGFGILALVLACIGIYGIMAYTVARRTNEIGIRMALGAQSGRVLRMILREASWLAVIGIFAGLAIAIAMGRLIASMLFGLKSYDPLTLGGAALMLISIALAASLVPARRAATIDPIKALRHE